MRDPLTSARLLACAVLLAASCDRAPEETTPSTPAGASAPGHAASGSSSAADFDPRTDDRFAFLLGECTRTEPFTADTSDLMPALVAKLAVAESVVASRAREDLIAAGRGAVPELRRALDRWYSEPGMAPRLLALLEIASLAGGPETRAMGLSGLQHPSETVCSAAARALASAGQPEDFDVLAAPIEHSGLEYAKQAGRALLACDPARVAREFPAWMDRPGFARVLKDLAPAVSAKLTAEDRARMIADPRSTGTLRAWLLAASAESGDESARATLRAALADPATPLREDLVQAATASGLLGDVIALADSDPDPGIRALAVQAAAARPESSTARSQISAALADGDPTVRATALNVLCARMDPAGIDRAIELLAGTNEQVTQGLSALRAPLAQDARLAGRVLDRLLELVDGGGRSAGQAIERAISQVPLERAARFLVERGRTTPGLIQDLPAHRWYAVQAGNTGTPGRAWIREQWDVEKDPLRRLDLLVAGVQEKGPAVPQFLLHVMESERALDMERLLAADLFARAVPAFEAAPVLKRIAPRITDPTMHRALDCELWRFYGPER